MIIGNWRFLRVFVFNNIYNLFLIYNYMRVDNINRERTMHIDTSCKLYESKNTGIAYKIIGSNKHKGLALKRSLKNELKKDLNVDYDYARLYAICIFYLIKDDLDLFDTLIICGDEHFLFVKEHLSILFEEDSTYHSKIIMSIAELREITGNPKLRSYADGVARSYRRRALKCLARQQQGTTLNIVKINYNSIRILWEEIDNKIKSVSGE